LVPRSANALLAAALSCRRGAGAALLAILALACVQAKTLGGGGRPLADDASGALMDAGPGSAADAAAARDHGALADRAETPSMTRDAAELDAAAEVPPIDSLPIDVAAAAADGDGCSPGCGPERECSYGVCVCAPGSCNEGTLFTDPAGVGFPTAGSNFLLYASSGELKKVDLASRQVSPLYGLKQGVHGVGAVAVDAQDTIYWCRDARGDGSARPWDLMRNDQLLQAGFCGPGYLGLTDADVYYSDGNNVYRRRFAKAGRETVVQGPGIDSVALGGNYLYYSSSLHGLPRVYGVNLGDLSQRMWFDAGPDQSQILQVAVDERHLYIKGAIGIRRIPLAGGPVEPLVAPDSDRLMGWFALSRTHIYWISANPSAMECDTRLYRMAKSGDPVELLVTLPGRCSDSYALQNNRVYIETNNETQSGPGVVYGIRQ
jgi:hypothetical protein